MQKIREFSKKGMLWVFFSCRGGFYARPAGNAVDVVDGVDEVDGVGGRRGIRTLRGYF
jgi:hypothetical protein